MTALPDLPLLSVITLYALLVFVTFLVLVLLWWQVQVIAGKRMPNTDGTFDDWHEQNVIFGHTVADIFFACPLGIATVVLILLGSVWGFFLLPMVGFWFVYANTITTATSLRFARPKLTVMWFIIFPLGILVGVAILVWTAVHFRAVYPL